MIDGFAFNVSNKKTTVIDTNNPNNNEQSKNASVDHTNWYDQSIRYKYCLDETKFYYKYLNQVLNKWNSKSIKLLTLTRLMINISI